MNKVLPLLIGVVGLTAPVAASPMSDNCLTIEDAMKLSASRDPNVQAARAERMEAAADVKDARALRRPKLDSFARTGVGDVGAIDSVVQNQVGLRASQRVFDFGDSRLALQAARSREMAGVETVRQEQVFAAQDTAIAFIDLLEADAQLEATQERRRYFNDLLQSVETLLSRGGATRSERADIAARLADAEAVEQELRFLKARARTQIELDTGLETQACPAAGALDELSARHQDVFDNVDVAMDAALTQSPVLRSLELKADSLDAVRQREKRARLPAIDLVGVAAYASRGSDGIYEFQDRIGVDISIPLYSGASLDARYERAEARNSFAVAEAARARRRLREEVRVAYQRILSLESQLLSRRSVEAHKREELDAANVEYERGVRTLRELIETRLDFEDAMLNRIGVAFELQRQRLDLLSLTGRLPVDDALQDSRFEGE